MRNPAGKLTLQVLYSVLQDGVYYFHVRYRTQRWGEGKTVKAVFPSAATVLSCNSFSVKAGYPPISDNVSNLLMGYELLTLAASVGSRPVWAMTWGMRHDGCDQDVKVAEMQRNGSL